MKLITLALTALMCFSSCSASAAAKHPATQDVIQVTFRAEVNGESMHGFSMAWSTTLAKKPNAILLVIDSIGGDVESGWKIVQMIQESPIPVHCIVDGRAGSIAFVILQSCTTRGMTLGSEVMAHQPKSVLSSDDDEPLILGIRDLKRILVDLQLEADRMAIFSAKRMKMPVAAFEAQVEVDWAMSSAMALKMNAVDHVVSNVAAARKKLEQKLEPPPHSP